MPFHPSELPHRRCLRSKIDGHGTPWAFSQTGGDTTQIQPNGDILSDDLALCLKMAIEGVGLAHLIETLVTPHLDDPSLVPIPIQD